MSSCWLRLTIRDSDECSCLSVFLHLGVLVRKVEGSKDPRAPCAFQLLKKGPGAVACPRHKVRGESGQIHDEKKIERKEAKQKVARTRD